MKKIVLGIVGVLLLLVAIVLVKTAIHPFAKHAIETQNKPTENYRPTDEAIQRFAGGLRVPTISYEDSTLVNNNALDSFRQYIQQAFPRVFSNTKHYTINTHAQVLIWKGKNSSLKPLLLLAHYDVVPPGDTSNLQHSDCATLLFNVADTSDNRVTKTASVWQHPPFAGMVTPTKIYGRGALDDKGMLFSVLEATDSLMALGFVPERDIYFAFGHDEEVSGLRGAMQVAKHFEAQKLEFEAVFDEGGIIAEKGSIKGVESDIALIGLAEKGFASYRVKVKGTGGHSSMPPLQSAMGKAAIIMQRLENNQVPQVLIEPVENFFNTIGGQMGFASKMAIANQWLLQPVLFNQLAKVPATNALTRTTTALTMMKGSDASNVLPPIAEFVVNFRIINGSTIEETLAHLQKACEGFEVEIEPVRPPKSPSNISPTDSKPFEMMKKTLQKIYPNIIVSPYVTIGGTDAIKYQNMSKNVYRFIPMKLNEAEQRSIHNQNEHISIENYGRMIAYFFNFLQQYDK